MINWRVVLIIVCRAPSPEYTDSGDYRSSAARAAPKARAALDCCLADLIEESVRVFRDTCPDASLFGVFCLVLDSVGARKGGFSHRRW